MYKYDLTISRDRVNEATTMKKIDGSKQTKVTYKIVQFI
jgi:hypothetical protein